MTTTKRTFLVGTLVFVSLAFFTKNQWLNVYTPAPEKSVPAQKAYFRSEWGMSPEEVSRANEVLLVPQTTQQRLYEAPTGQESRYQTLQTQGRFLSREAIIYYTFMDERLVSYHIFLTDSDGEALDKDMRRYFFRTYGEDSVVVDDGSPLKLLWEKRGMTANYWYFIVGDSEPALYKAGIGVLNKY